MKTCQEPYVTGAERSQREQDLVSSADWSDHCDVAAKKSQAQFRSFAPNVLPLTRQPVTAELCLDSPTVVIEFTVHNYMNVEENNS